MGVDSGSGLGIVSNKKGTRFRLRDFSRGWRRTRVDDVESFAKAEILVRDDFNGLGSRGS